MFYRQKTVVDSAIHHPDFSQPWDIALSLLATGNVDSWQFSGESLVSVLSFPEVDIQSSAPCWCSLHLVTG
jgi:hypothetical protein